MSEFDDLPLGYLLYRATTALHPRMNARLRPLGLTVPALVCMKLLAVRPGLSNAELARTVNVSPQTMNTVLRGLQERGAVVRPATVTSGRALPAQLTAEGRKLMRRAQAAVRAADEEVLAALTPARRRELKRLLGAIGEAEIVDQPR
ncbi:MarR family winged helix-turn-helix transcriptional regulator [Nocardia terpenica]|uniref:MarR family transcriptional regulator n=1 Tax=Nocardia terpenica TaxID=455432 RepID=A0A291RN72_9NOCA|nr:MarR family transcriptional regulator [Nocardia terpenica]ATL68748.1 MarR family transcriptional regulator [Nocardia terpenica]